MKTRTCRCPVCGRPINTTKNGKIATHGKRAYVSDSACKGSGSLPRETHAEKIVPDHVESGSAEHLAALSKFFGL